MGANPKSLNIPDARGNQACLRVTRHPAERKIVVSHWRQGLCVASTPVDLSDVPALIGVLATALGDAAASSATATAIATAIPEGGPGATAGIPGVVSPRSSAWVTLRHRVVRSPWWAAPDRFARRFIRRFDRPTKAEVTVLRARSADAPGPPRRPGSPRRQGPPRQS